MEQAVLWQLLGSAAAVSLLAAVAAWARIPRPVTPLDDARALTLLADELPDEAFERVWIDAAGDVAVARSGEVGHVLFRVGDSYAVRSVPWSRLAAAPVKQGRAVIAFDDPAAPRVAFRLGEGASPFAA